ncbi:MAG: hypothetical protein ABW001_10120 [Mycobacterium sp.]
MPGISPLIVQLFDDPHARRRHAKRRGDPERDRFETKGRVARRRSK